MYVYQLNTPNRLIYILNFFFFFHLVLDYGLYPKAIGEILQSYKVHEMHLTFTQGRWNYEEWGYPPTLSAGTGVELWAWMKDSNK